VAGGEVLADSGFGALPPLVGSFQGQAEDRGGVDDGEAVEGGYGEQFDVVLAQRGTAVGHVGDQFVERGLQATGEEGGEGRVGTVLGGRRPVEVSPPVHLGVADAAVDQFAAEVGRVQRDAAQTALETDVQVVIDVIEFTTAQYPQGVAPGAQAADGEAEREDPVRLGGIRLAGAIDDGGPDPVALRVVGVFDQEALELARGHVARWQARGEAVGADIPRQQSEAVRKPVEQRLVPGDGTVPHPGNSDRPCPTKLQVKTPGGRCGPVGLHHRPPSSPRSIENFFGCRVQNGVLPPLHFFRSHGSAHHDRRWADPGCSPPS